MGSDIVIASDVGNEVKDNKDYKYTDNIFDNIYANYTNEKFF